MDSERVVAADGGRAGLRIGLAVGAGLVLLGLAVVAVRPEMVGMAMRAVHQIAGFGL